MTVMTQTTQAATGRAGLAGRFLECLGRRDFEAIRNLLAANVWFRALLPRQIYEFTSADDAVAALRGWFGGASQFRVLATEHHRLAQREFILYRFLMLPDWAPEEWHVIEQAGFVTTKEDHISRLDLACTGFFPAGAPEPVREQTRSN